MPTFSYKGYDFDVDHTPTADEFTQLQAHVDSLPPKDSKASQVADLLNPEQATKAAEGLVGVGEAAAGMASGLPSQLAGGLMGLSTLAAGQGIDKAGQKVRDTISSNFGFGEYKPRTKAGEQATEKIGEGMEGAINLAGKGGQYIGGDLGETNAKIAAESLMNLIEPGIAFKMGKKAIKKAVERMSPDAPKEVQVDAAKAMEDQVAAKAAEQASAQADVGELNQVLGRDRMEAQLRNQPPKVSPNDALIQNLKDATMREQAGRMEQETAIRKQLEEKLAADKAAERPGLTSMEGIDGQQSLFDQPDVMGQRNQFNGGELGDWRIDENGMPVKVDKSMEAMNLENPLQRNMWGDELGPALGQDRGLTAAIDATPANGQWAQRRQQINRLGGRGQELLASPELEAAKIQADGPLLPHEPTAAFDPRNPLPTEPLGKAAGEPPGGLPEAPVPPRSGGDGGSIIEPRPFPMEPEVSGKAVDKSGTEWDSKVTQQMVGQGADRSLGVMVELRDAQGRRAGVIDFKVNPDGTLAAENTMVSPQMQGRGLAEQMYKAAKEAGYDVVPGRYQTPEGQKMVEALQKKGLIGEGKITPIEQHQMNVDIVKQMDESQTGASAKLEPLPPEERPVQQDTIARPISPEKIEEKRTLARAAERTPIDPKVLDEYTGIRTKEEAKARLADDGYKDISKDYGQKSLSSGINFTASLTNSPVLKFARTVLRDARVASEAFSRKYVTAKDGVSPMWSKMDGQQRIDVMAALREGDKHQTKVTDATMDNMGFTPEQKQFVNKFYEADDALYARYNGNLMANGMKPLVYREGHFPGVFKGAYKSLVTDAKGNTIGVIATDSVYQRNKATKWFEENHKGSTIVHQERKGLADFKNQSDIFSGMNDVMQLLAENDPRFAEVQAIVSEAIKHGNNSIFAFNRHELSKKGVIGSEGNKPWLEEKQNSEANFKALVQYLEEGALHHELQQPLKDLKELSTDPDLTKIPNTMKYLDNYINHVTGQSIHPIGRGIDAILDFAPKLVGVGPRVPLQIAGTIKNKMSQKFMGFGNWTFMAAQLAQPLQTGLPFLQMAAGRLGLGASLDTPRAMMNGGTQFMLAALGDMTGKKVAGLQGHMAEAYQYAKDRGLLNFSEMEKAYEGNKTTIGRGFDWAAEANMKVGEAGTRTPMFMTYTDLLHKAGMDMKDALPIAENLTQLSMIDYHQWERPMAYQRLGTIGGFAGGLTTFKHGFTGQQMILGKEVLKHGNPLPIAMSVAAMIAFAGITGMPFYDELDNVYGSITNQFMGGRKTIKESVLQNLPEWSKSGAIANATNVGIGSKFSSANMVPDTLAKAASPQLEALGVVIGNVYDYIKNGDAQAARNLLQSVVPSSLAGEAEHRMARDSENYVIGKDGKRVIQRSPEDWDLRRMTGMRPQSEVVAREDTYKQRMKLQADTEKLKALSKKMERGEINGTLTPAEIQKLEKEVFLRGGEPGSLVKKIGQATVDAKKTEKQRLEGTPTGYTGMKKFQNYNPPPVNKPGER